MPSTYSSTLDYLFSRLPMYQRVGKAAYKADLSNTWKLARLTGNPERGLKCIHIAGTNGKGSTAHILAAIFQTCGYRTGLMTSPHYLDFRERIRIDGQMIEEDYVVEWVERYKQRTERIEPSFFELTVMMGFSYFQEKEVDIAIIETGLGGRLDSTNIVDPELSIITSIGLDHTQFLGDTLEQIAKEKGGIIKEGRPVVIGPGNETVIEVLEGIAKDNDSALHLVEMPIRPIPSDLRASYQQKNLATALSAVTIMGELGWTLDSDKVSDALLHVSERTGMMGRWQLLSDSPLTIADSAHNAQSIASVLDELEQIDYTRLHIVLAMVDDKDVRTVLQLLPEKASYYFSQAAIQRAMKKEILQEHAAECRLNGKVYSSVAKAVEAARSSAGSDDLVMVTGSIFTVAEVV